MKPETKGEPRSEIIFVGRPQFANTRRTNIFATPNEVSLVVVGSRVILFEKRSTIMMMESYPCEIGKGPIMSIEIVCQGLCGPSGGTIGPPRALRSNLLRWHG